MALIDRFLDRAVKRGELTLIRPDGTTRSFGSHDPDLKPVTMRLSKGAEGRIVRDPALGAAETYMDGSMNLEQGDILDLLNLVTANNAWEKSNAVLNPSKLSLAAGKVAHLLGRYNMARKSKQNVAHHYDLSARLYDLFLDADRQNSCAYYTDPANSLEQAQADKKAHIVAKDRKSVV